MLRRILRTTEFFLTKSTPAAKQGHCQNQGRGVVDPCKNMLITIIGVTMVRLIAWKSNSVFDWIFRYEAQVNLDCIAAKIKRKMCKIQKRNKVGVT